MEQYERSEMIYSILDTNIILLDVQNIITLGQPGTTVVLSETVVNEIDSKKSVQGELGFQARSFGRLIAKGKIGTPISKNKLVITPVTLESGTLVHITSTEYPRFTDVAANTLNDRKIIEVAIQYQESFGNSTFISNDVMCRITAMALGVTCTDLKVTEKISYQFTKDFQVDDPEVFRTLHGSEIALVNLNHEVENYGYKFTCNTTNQMKLGTITNGIVSILGKDSEREIRKQE
jgi:predicted ribonuclease YlaK